MMEPKAKAIDQALSANNDVGLRTLRKLALSDGGLVNDTLRQQAWPQFLGLDVGFDDSGAGNEITPDLVIRCNDFEQIELDTTRCNWHLLTATQQSQRLHRQCVVTTVSTEHKKRQLANLVNYTLLQSYQRSASKGLEEPMHYYQGYHDVASIFLQTFDGAKNSGLSLRSRALKSFSNEDLEIPAAILLEVSQKHLLDCLKPNFRQVQTALRLTLLPLLAALDRDISTHLHRCGMEPFFAFSWVITWFSSENLDTELIKRLFDVFLVSDPLMPIYVAVAMVLHPINRAKVLETECDFGLLHETLRNLPKSATLSSSSSSQYDDMTSCSDPADVFPVQEVIDMAVQYQKLFSPEKILDLARQYHGREQVELLLLEAPDINILQTSISPTTTFSLSTMKFTRRTESWLEKIKQQRRKHAASGFPLLQSFSYNAQ